MSKFKTPRLNERVSLAAAIAGISLPFLPVAATSQPTATLEEVTVTARKREESLQRVPISITALSEKSLQEMNMVSLDNVSQAAPNVRISRGGVGGSTGIISIRGQYQQESQFSFDPSVGVYLDGIYVARSPGLISNLYDINRVEVLKGPQGTLWGRNTPGGAVAVYSNSAQINETSGSLRARYGSDNELSLEGVVNLPLIEDIAALRLVAAWDQKDGWAEEQVSGEELGGYENAFWRSSLVLTPNERLAMELKFDYHDYENERAWTKLSAYNPVAGNNLAGEAASAAALFQGQSALDGFNDLDNNLNLPVDSTNTSPIADKMSAVNDRVGGSDTRLWGAVFKFDYDFSENLTFTSVTGYRDMETASVTDVDGTEYIFATSANDDEQNQLSQEFKLQGVAFDDKLNWVAGLYYFSEDGSLSVSSQQAYGLTTAGAVRGFIPGFTPPADPAEMPAFIAGVVEQLEANPRVGLGDVDNKSIAVYGQGTYQFTDKLSATFGYRYTEDSRELDVSATTQLFGVCAIQFDQLVEARSIDRDNCVASFKDEYDGDSWTIGLEYLLSDETMIYAKSSRGFRSGGRNLRGIDAIGLQAVDPEQVTDIELGIKTNLWNNRARINAAVFESDYQDLQRNSITFNEETRSTVSAVENIQEASIRGFEIEASFVISENFEAGGTYGYIEAEYDKFLTAGGDDRTEEPFAYTPEKTYSLYVVGNTRIGEVWELMGRLDYSYTDKINYQRGLPQETADSYALLGGRIALSNASADLEIALYGRNLTDEEYVLNQIASYGQAGFVSDRLGDPRAIGIEVRKQF